MGKKLSVVFLGLLVLCYAICVRGFFDGGYAGERGYGEGQREKHGGEGEGRRSGDGFLLQDSKHVVKTEAGEMKVIKGYTGFTFVQRPMHIGFITMEPTSLFIPQYLDSSLILFIRRGEARIGSIRKDELVEEDLKTGDLYRIDAGSAFYLVNRGEGQRLQIICSIDTSESLNWHDFQSFFIGGGRSPPSILSGFDPQTLSTAFNASLSELGEVMSSSQQDGPIVFLPPDSHPPSMWTRFLALDKHEKKGPLKGLAQLHEDVEGEEEKAEWSLRKFVIPLLGGENRKSGKMTSKSDGTYNLYDRKPDFRNDYGWSMEVDGSDYSPLGRSGIGVYLVNLTAAFPCYISRKSFFQLPWSLGGYTCGDATNIGSMMAPHINPSAAEYGIVLRGTGRIQIVYPNGTLAMNARVSEGDVFFTPRYFAFCQISSRTGPFEFFGFTTSSRKNRPLFLVGRNSLLQTMMGPELAAAFGIPEDKLRKFIEAQGETTILPTASVAPPDQAQVHREMVKMMPKVIKSVVNDMIMDF